MPETPSFLHRRGPNSAPLVAVAVGSGRVTAAAVEAGVDCLLALSAGVYRHHGVGSLASFLASGNANAQTLDLLRTHCLPRRSHTPVFAGVLAGDPTQTAPEMFARLRELGVEGVTNWPAVGFVDGNFRAALEEAGLGVAGEAAMLAEAKAAGFATLGFALAEEDALAFVAAGVDGLVFNLGLTRAIEDVIERRDQLQECAGRLQRLLATARRERPVVCFAFGGPVLAPEDWETLFRQTTVDGFAGGSVFERLPVQSTVAATVRGFKAVTRRPLGGASGLGDLLGRSRPMREAFRLLERVAPTEVSVCLAGETGTGKELAATLLHRLSPRAAGPFVTVNCGAIPGTLIESELFGHEKGAFTGAHRRRPGKFELAHGGTLFLDEIGDLSAHGQVALLRALQQREITRVGGDTPIPVDARIVAATHVDLAARVTEGRFRADLYFRLNEFTVELPPLRERLDDLPTLVDAFLERLSARLGRRLVGLTAEFFAKLRAHAWPGNVRELQHGLAQAALREDGTVLTGAFFRPSSSPPGAPDIPLAATRLASPAERAEAALRAVAEAGGNKAAAARRLGVTRKTLYAWLGDNAPA